MVPLVGRAVCWRARLSPWTPAVGPGAALAAACGRGAGQGDDWLLLVTVAHAGCCRTSTLPHDSAEREPKCRRQAYELNHIRSLWPSILRRYMGFYLAFPRLRVQPGRPGATAIKILCTPSRAGRGRAPTDYVLLTAYCVTCWRRGPWTSEGSPAAARIRPAPAAAEPRDPSMGRALSAVMSMFVVITSIYIYLQVRNSTQHAHAELLVR
jgi:hypothetical protein